jgi:NAD(P)-dependent dehydrogenase (short-subunit alcohol dehydrogenase family)
MELNEARTLVVGATGVLGVAVTHALHDAGARVVVTGRDPDRLAHLADVSDEALELDLLDVDACRAVVARAAERLDGLDLVVVASGVAGFGTAQDTPDAVTEELFAVNTLGPIAVLAASVPVLRRGGTLVALSAILADAPMAGMAAYSASKAGLSAYLSALRREVRRQGLTVLDVRPPHMETGLAERAVAGDPPRLPAGQDVAAFVGRLVEGIRSGARELVWDPTTKALALC